MNNDHPIGKGLRRTDPDSPRPLADALLRLIWNQRRISRAEIARMAGLSRSTVSEVINEILPTGLVAEMGEGPSGGGRRPIVLEFQNDAACILGVEMGGAHVAVALTNLRGQVLHWETQDHRVRRDPAGTRKVVADLCARCLETDAAASRPLVGIGVAVPCPVDPANPNRLSSVVLPEWHENLGLEPLAARYDVPLLIDNDANLGALAEYWWGIGGETDNLAYIKVATGVGSGHIINGEIYRGSTGVAGEIGHVAIDPQGKQCICGLRGCLVTLVGARGLEARARELSAEIPESSLAGRDVLVQEIEEAALAGDSLALKVIREAADNLGTAVAGLLNLMNPETVVFGGDLCRLGEVLLKPLRERIQARTLVSSVAAAEIRASKLGPQSVAIGAATLVLKAGLEDSRIFSSVTSTQTNGTGT